MSAREDVQDQISTYLHDKGHYDAPYGIIEGMRPMGHGKCRTITFGVSRLLDATIDILRVDKIQLSGIGPLARAWEIEYGKQEFKSVDELIGFLNKKSENWG